MNAKESKGIPITDILAHHGHEPARPPREGSRQVWYFSPFTQENTPSMHVDTHKNIYKDFSSQHGGDALHLVTKLREVDNKQALAWMREFGSKLTPISAQRPLPPRPAITTTDNPLQLQKAGEIKNPSLLRYVTEERKISPEVARKYLREVRYRNGENKKNYYGVGMRNTKGGYDVRSALPNSKMVVGAFGITTLKGTHRDNKIDVFESRWDFLTKATMSGGKHRDTVIVNAAANVGTAVDYLKKLPHDKLIVYKHNDEKQQGQRFFDALRQSGKSLVDRSSLYPNFKDLNEAYQANGQNLFVKAAPKIDYRAALEKRLTKSKQPVAPAKAQALHARQRI